jgi:hypothetical protein
MLKTTLQQTSIKAEQEQPGTMYNRTEKCIPLNTHPPFLQYKIKGSKILTDAFNHLRLTIPENLNLNPVWKEMFLKRNYFLDIFLNSKLF